MGWPVSLTNNLPYLAVRNGMNFRQPIPLLSKEQKIYAVLAGRINDADFAQAVDKSTEKMASVLSRCRLTDKELLHRRGHYATLWAGISRGQGQKVSGPTLAIISDCVHIRG